MCEIFLNIFFNVYKWQFSLILDKEAIDFFIYYMFIFVVFKLFHAYVLDSMKHEETNINDP